MTRATFVSCALAIAVPLMATAQTALTLADAQAEARAHAPDVAELDALVRGTEAVAAQAQRRLRQNPEISVNVGSGALAGRTDEWSWTVGASLPVDLSGSWRPRTASANADVTRATREREDGLRALDERTANAVADVALQQRSVARLERILELQQFTADAAHRQLDVGQGTELDADSADLDLVATRVSVDQARGDLAGARAHLARLLGRLSSSGLVVADPSEQSITTEVVDFEAVVDRDPRVLAAASEVDAAKFERQMFERLVAPTPAFGLGYGYQRRDIPAGSFSGAPFSNSLTALWPDRELTFGVNIGVPFFDRQQEPRAKATGRLLTAEGRLQTTRADVRTELMAAWETLQAASRALQRVATVDTTITRDMNFVEQAVRTGALDGVQRTQALRRLVEAGRVSDTTVRNFRVARAAWVRRERQ